jgi:hypothetical protein
MNLYEVEALMRFTAYVSYNGLSSEANTLIDTAASLNFVSKEFVVTNGFYKDFKTVPKLPFEWLVSSVSLRLRCFVLRFFPLMDTNLLTYSSESYLTLKVRILYWDYMF